MQKNKKYGKIIISSRNIGIRKDTELPREYCTAVYDMIEDTLSYLTDPLDSTDEVLTTYVCTLCNKSVTTVIEYIHETTDSSYIPRTEYILSMMRPATTLIFVYIPT